MQGSFSAADWIFQLGGMLLLVIALILTLAWLSRRISNPSLNGLRRMKIIDTLMLGRTERVALVQVGEQYQLLGISGHGINLLGQFDEIPPTINAATDTPFSKLFSQALTSNKSKTSSTDNSSNTCLSSSETG